MGRLTLTRGATATSLRASRAKMLWVVFMLVVSGVALVGGWLNLRLSQRLATEGEFTMARVVRKHVEPRRGGVTAHYLDLEYRTNAGQTMAESDRVSQNGYQRTNARDIVPVHYLPSDPTVHALGRNVQPDYFLLLLSLLFFAITGVYYFFGRA